MSLVLLLRSNPGPYIPPPVYGDPTFSRLVSIDPGRIGTSPDYAGELRIGASPASAGASRRKWGAS